MRTVSGGAFARTAPFLQLGDAGPLLQRTGFAVPVTDIEAHTIRYADPLALMRELKALGASNPLADRPSRLATPHLIAEAAAAYERLAGDPDGRVRATLADRLDVGLGAAREPAEAAAPGLRQGQPDADVLGKKTAASRRSSRWRNVGSRRS